MRLMMKQDVVDHDVRVGIHCVLGADRVVGVNVVGPVAPTVDRYVPHAAGGRRVDPELRGSDVLHRDVMGGAGDLPHLAGHVDVLQIDPGGVFGEGTGEGHGP